MTNAETIGQPVLEQKRHEQDLRMLHMKAGQHAAKFAMLAQLLRDDPGAIVFDQQDQIGAKDICLASSSHLQSGELCFYGIIKALIECTR